jgi:methylmalonyl-CoA/ethylmalonyl-CoA epimerase
MLRATACRRFFNPLPGVGKLNHVAIAVPKDKCIQAAAARYGALVGAKISAPQDLPEHGVTTVFVELPNTKIELLHPLGEKSPIQAFLNKNPDGGMHHICLDVEDIHAGIARCKEANIRTIGKEPKIGAHGKPVIFLHPKDCGGVLVELEQM